MSGLGPEARAIIDAADGTDLPGADDKERMRERLGAAIGAAVVGAAATGAAVKGTTATAVMKGAGAGAASTTLLAKLLGAALLVGAASAGYVAGRRSDVDATRAVAPAPSPVMVGGPAPKGESTPAQIVVAPAEPPVATSSPTGAARPTVAPMAARAPAPTTTTTTTAAAAAPTQAPSHAPAPSELEGEAALLQRARAAIDSGDGVTALDALDAHERRFPAGILAEQRLAERVVAMCTIAKVPLTRERAEHFLAARPRSQQADRIRRACGLP